MGWHWGLRPHNEPRDTHHITVEMTFRDAAVEERHDEKDRTEWQERFALLEAKVTALEMGDRDA